MTCCKCLEFNWDRPAETVWEDPDGQEYCVYHAPKDGKGLGAREFNQLIFRTLKEADTTNKTCELSGVIFPWNIIFSPRSTGERLPTTILYNAEFHAHVRFSRYKKIRHLDLSSAHFYQPFALISCDFDEQIDLNDLACDGRLNIHDCKFKNDCQFNGITVNSTAFVYRCIFFGDTDFGNTIFKSGIEISATVFYKTTHFNSIHVDGSTRITNCNFYECTSFENSYFFGPTNFTSSNFLNETKFCRTIFSEATRFTKCKTGPGILDFRDIQVFSKMLFSLMDMRRTNFLFVRLDSIDFQNTSWEKSSDGSRYVTAFENDHSTDIDTLDLSIDQETTLKGIIDFYRQMKKKCKDNLDDEEVSLWHCAEKETRLKLLRQQHSVSFQRLILETYRSVSRYGENPRQAAEVLLYLSLLLLASLALGGLYALGEPPFDITAPRVAKGLRAFAQYALFMKPDWSPPAFFDFIAILLSRLLIPIQAAIFAFALRNKLHR